MISSSANIAKNKPNQITNFDSLISFVNSKIYCKSHPNQPAQTLCMDCKAFCCMIESCGQPHIYHSIENLDYLVNSQIFPFLNTLKEVNTSISNNKAMHLTNIHIYKNNLKTFAVEEKKAIDEEYRKILSSLQTIYNSHMEDINGFIDDLSNKFEALQERVNSMYMNSADIMELNNYVTNLLEGNSGVNSGNNKAFICHIAKDAKHLNQKLKGVSFQVAKFDFEKEIGDIKAEAEKTYTKIEKGDYFRALRGKFEEEVKIFMQNKIRNEERQSLSKMKKMVSMRQSNAVPKDNYNMDIDLDIFVRYLHEEINKIRSNPAEVLKILDEYVEIMEDMPNLNQSVSLYLNETINNTTSLNTKIAYIYDYINNLTGNSVSLAPFEWDNDLSNSAEDYLKLTQGKIEKDHSAYLTHMKEIVVTNYYSNYQDINSLTYTGTAQLNKVLMHIFLNEHFWDNNTKQNIILSTNYNVIGICGISMAALNKITIIVNLSYLNK